MSLEKSYKITKWTAWSDLIGEAIDDFRAEFGLSPNILVATAHTFSQIEYVVNIIPGSHKNVIYFTEDKEEVPATEEDRLELTHYKYGDCLVQFAYMPEGDIQDKQFILMYEEDPDWGQESDEPDTPVGHGKNEPVLAD